MDSWRLSLSRMRGKPFMTIEAVKMRAIVLFAKTKEISCNQEKNGSDDGKYPCMKCVIVEKRWSRGGITKIYDKLR